MLRGLSFASRVNVNQWASHKWLAGTGASLSAIMAEPFRIAVDTGGTFTDCVWVERGQLRMLKVFSTPGDPSEAIAAAVARVVAQRKTSEGVLLLHGTTVGTNALL